MSTVGLVAYVAILAVATTAGHLLAGPDPRLLRAACASKTASYGARSLVSMASIPKRSEVIPMMAQAWEVERRAWADVDVECD